MSIQQTRKRSVLSKVLMKWFMSDRSRVIPKATSDSYANQLERSIGAVRPDLMYLFYQRVRPAAIDAETEKERYEEGRESRIAAQQEIGRLVGQIADWDEQTALLLGGPRLWVKIIMLSVFSYLDELRLTAQRPMPKQFRDPKDYSTWMVLFTAIPLWLSTCRLVGIRINHGITAQSILPLLLILGFSVVVNLSLKIGVALWVQMTRHGVVQEDGAVQIAVVERLSDPVLMFSVGVVVLEMLVGAPGIIGALPITIAKQPLWQGAALLLGGMGAVANQVLAWTSGIKAKRRELRWLHFRAQQDALWNERCQQLSQAFELQKLLPELQREEGLRKRRWHAAYQQALRVYRYWWRHVSIHLEEERNRYALIDDRSNGHHQKESSEESLR